MQPCDGKQLPVPAMDGSVAFNGVAPRILNDRAFEQRMSVDMPVDVRSFAAVDAA